MKCAVGRYATYVISRTNTYLVPNISNTTLNALESPTNQAYQNLSKAFTDLIRQRTNSSYNFQPLVYFVRQGTTPFYALTADVSVNISVTDVNNILSPINVDDIQPVKAAPGCTLPYNVNGVSYAVCQMDPERNAFCSYSKNYTNDQKKACYASTDVILPKKEPLACQFPYAPYENPCNDADGTIICIAGDTHWTCYCRLTGLIGRDCASQFAVFNCTFPFTYNGVNYTTCITKDYGFPWCSRTANFDLDKQLLPCRDDGYLTLSNENWRSNHFKMLFNRRKLINAMNLIKDNVSLFDKLRAEIKKTLLIKSEQDKPNDRKIKMNNLFKQELQHDSLQIRQKIIDITKCLQLLFERLTKNYVDLLTKIIEDYYSYYTTSRLGESRNETLKQFLMTFLQNINITPLKQRSKLDQGLILLTQACYHILNREYMIACEELFHVLLLMPGDDLCFMQSSLTPSRDCSFTFILSTDILVAKHMYANLLRSNHDINMLLKWDELPSFTRNETPALLTVDELWYYMLENYTFGWLDLPLSPPEHTTVEEQKQIDPEYVVLDNDNSTVMQPSTKPPTAASGGIGSFFRRIFGFRSTSHSSWNRARKYVMNYLLHTKQIRYEQITANLNWPMIPRTKDGWYLSAKHKLKMKQNEADSTINTYATVIGIQINISPGNCDYLFESKSNNCPTDLISDNDFGEIMRMGLDEGIVFSLDELNDQFSLPSMNHYPYQRMRFKSDKLIGSDLLLTMFHADYLLKLFVTGIEVNPLPPYNLRSMHDGLLKRLPDHLREILKPLHEYNIRNVQMNQAHRFWIDSSPIECKLIEKNDDDEHIITFYFNDVRMIVEKHLLTRNACGDLIDAEESADESDTSPEAKFARDF
ncbi:unnamed protein product, partial [Didymodactylos carnosus]